MFRLSKIALLGNLFLFGSGINFALIYTIGGPIQCLVSCRDQCAHKHTNMSLY